MDIREIFEGVLLGFVQGVTEFLPVSSSGHLALFGDIILSNEKSMDLFTGILLHLGTLGAVLVVFAREIFPVFLSPFIGFAKHRSALRTYEPLRLLGLVLLASIPVALAGLFFGGEVEKLMQSPRIVACLLACTGIILLATEYYLRKREHPADPDTSAGKKNPSVKQALLIGLAQAAAIFPGLSRSGLTISAARLCGLQRERAGVFSFLLFIPAVAGATLLETVELLRAEQPCSCFPAAASISAFHIAGFIASFVFGFLALTFLVRLLKSGRFHIFGWYCLAAAIFWFTAL